MAPAPGKVMVDGTAGAGGHTSALAERVLPGGRVIGLDRDPDMLELARSRCDGLPVELVHSPYDELGEVLSDRGLDGVDGLLVDLGLSSDQLAWADRGFSFALDGPLDMRFDPTDGPTAADLLNSWPEERLADVFYQYGEERHSRRIARRVVEERRKRRIETTQELARIIRASSPGKWGAIDPSTRVFQALRIAVNGELDRLDRFLQQAPDWLRPGGRLVVISFHSLEDRRVKNAFRGDDRLEVLTRKVVVATDEERNQNPRARSAKLRVAQRWLKPHGPGSSPSGRRPRPGDRP